MRVISYTEASNGLKGVLDQVVNDANYTVITRADTDDAVVMSSVIPAQVIFFLFKKTIFF